MTVFRKAGATPEERLMRRVQKIDGCWLWTGAKSSGYGRMGLDGGLVYTHRFAYTTLVGPIPEDLELDHLCRNRACCNPAHLEPVTHLENVRRGAKAMSTHCVNGHEFTPENTYRRANGYRFCRTCCLAKNRARWKARA